MAETLKTSFRPWRYILIVATLFVLSGFIFGATNIPGLIIQLVALLAIVALIWFVANLIERRRRIQIIDELLQQLTVERDDAPRVSSVILIDQEIDELRDERATLTGWFAK